MWRRRTTKPAPGTEVHDGSSQALDQIANWVRFADTKATVLSAGLGVAITMLASNSAIIFKTMQSTWITGLIVGGLAVMALLAFGWTLFWLIRAIGPQRTTTHTGPNRFSWPSLARLNEDGLRKHLSRTTASEDAWQQTLDLSALADRKFAACARAVYGFGALLILGFSCVTVAMALSA